MDRPTTTISELPNEALTHIMAHVPLGRRLQSCALVSRACAAAAGAATQDVAFKHYRYFVHGCREKQLQDRLESFQAWLDKHAQHLTSLRFAGCSSERGSELRLAYTQLARLQTLDVQSSSLELVHQRATAADAAPQLAGATGGSLSSSSGASSVLPALATLRLHDVSLDHKVQLLQLRLPGLTELQLCGVAEGVERALLPHARGLAVLRLEGTPRFGLASLKALTPLSSMQHLQSLVLRNVPPSVAAAKLVGLLQPSVTALSLEALYGHALIRGASGDESAPAFMSALAQLTRLQSLQLEGLLSSAGCEPVAGTAELRVYSALTASSHISSIKIHSYKTLPLPRGALQHAFPPGRKLPHLRELDLHFEADELFHDPGDHPQAWCMDAADVNSIAAACPGLRSLSLGQVLKNEPETAGSLTRLQQLSSLSLSDATGWLTAEAAATLAHMSSLRELDVWRAPHLGDVGLQHWTALRQLNRLCVSAYYCGISGPVIGGHEDTQELELKTHAWSQEPDVWSQLVGRLEDSPQIHRLRMQEMQERLDDAEARLHNAEARADDAEARADDAEARAGDAEARADDAEERAGDAETRAASAEASEDSARARAAYCEARARNADALAQNAEARAQNAEARAAAAIAELRRRGVHV